MKVRAAIGRTALRTRLAAAGCCTLTVLATAAISACSGSPPSSPPVSSFSELSSPGTPTSGTPTSGTPTSGTPTSGTPTSGTPTSGTPTLESPSADQSQSPTPTQTPTPAPDVTAPPVTGGGGTAGFQDGLLLVLGVGAILAGAGSIAYRRRQTRDR
jgi:hypothetical protein